jgi:pimeloyl-ACP methyl ester carboxylesterase
MLRYADALWNERGAASLRGMVEDCMAEAAKVLPKGHCPELWLTGHSMGGSIAQILAVYFRIAHFDDAEAPDVTGVVTFGSPMAGNGAWKEFYEDQLGLASATVRWVYRDDPGPRFPPNPDGVSPVFRYAHAGRSLDLAPNGEGQEVPALLVGGRRAFSGWFSGNSLLKSFLRGEGFDHAAERVYIERFGEFCKGSGSPLRLAWHFSDEASWMMQSEVRN